MSKEERLHKTFTVLNDLIFLVEYTINNGEFIDLTPMELIRKCMAAMNDYEKEENKSKLELTEKKIISKHLLN